MSRVGRCGADSNTCLISVNGETLRWLHDSNMDGKTTNGIPALARNRTSVSPVGGGLCLRAGRYNEETSSEAIRGTRGVDRSREARGSKLRWS
jgi:hypothetical protein